MLWKRGKMKQDRAYGDNPSSNVKYMGGTDHYPYKIWVYITQYKLLSLLLHVLKISIIKLKNMYHSVSKISHTYLSLIHI